MEKLIDLLYEKGFPKYEEISTRANHGRGFRTIITSGKVPELTAILTSAVKEFLLIEGPQFKLYIRNAVHNEFGYDESRIYSLIALGTSGIKQKSLLEVVKQKVLVTAYDKIIFKGMKGHAQVLYLKEQDLEKFIQGHTEKVVITQLKVKF